MNDGTVRFPAECGCVVAVTLEEPPLSRDEVERGTDEFQAQLGPQWDRGGPLSALGAMPRGSSQPEVRFSDEQRAALRRMGVEEGDVRPGLDPLGARRARAFTDAALSARELIESEARRQVLAEAGTREAVLRATMAAAIAAGIQDQARRHPGFHCGRTSNADLFAVSGILTVSELVESVTEALRGIE